MWFSLLVDPWGEFSSVAWASWLLTYELHSSVICLVAAALMRTQFLDERWRHQCWQMAFVVPVLSSLLSVFLAEWAWAGVVLDVGWTQGAPGLTNSRSLLEAATRRGAAGPALPFVGVHAQTVLHFLLVVWAVVTALLLARVVVGAWQLLRGLRWRRPVADARLLYRLQKLCSDNGLPHRVRLSESARTHVPLVLGAREICLPVQGLQDLSDSEVDAVLAHELAHVERWDWLALPACALLEALLWVQPLNVWMLNRMRDSAELACDDRAVEWTGEPGALASAITQFAEQAITRRGLVLTPSMSYSAASPLFRVQRLIAREGARERGKPLAAAKWLPIALAISSMFAPNVRLAASAPVSVQPTSSRSRLGPAVDPEPVHELSLAERLSELDQREYLLYERLSTLGHRSSTSSGSEHRWLQLEQDLRHAEAERLWLLKGLERAQSSDAPGNLIRIPADGYAAAAPSQ